MINNKFILIITSILIIFTLIGCNDIKIYEDSGFILQVGVEKGIEDEYLYTITLPIFSEKEKNQIEIISTNTDLLKSTMDKSNMTSGKMLEVGKMQLLYFSEDVAKNGIHKILDSFERNPESSLLPLIVVTKDSPNKIINLAKKLIGKPRPAFYITELLENAIKSGSCPETRIFRFDINYYSQGIDSITPLLGIKNENIEVTGAALFKKDQLVGNLNTNESRLIHAMMGKSYYFEYFYKDIYPKDKSIINTAILLKETKRKVEIKIKNDIPVINISLNFDGEIDEYSGKDNFFDKEKVNELEKYISNSIKNECENILKYMQSVESDPIGFGNMVRVKYNSYFKSSDWYDLYSDTIFTVAINLNIQKHGVIN